jgi:hypothetical protein
LRAQPGRAGCDLITLADPEVVDALIKEKAMPWWLRT